MLDRLNEDQIPLLVNEALRTRRPSIISLLIDEGHLTHLSNEEILDIFEDINSYGFPEKIIGKLEEWFSWFKRGYIRFRDCYIYKNDVEILQEIERALNIKLIFTPFSRAISNHMFEIDDERRVSDLIIGSQTIKQIPDDIIEKIHTLKNFKGLKLPD